MKAGKELDTIIAEKVMGFHIDCYSSDIKAACKVLKEFAWVKLDCNNLIEEYTCTIGAIILKTDPRPPTSATANTLPLAICLAALKTKD